MMNQEPNPTSRRTSRVLFRWAVRGVLALATVAFVAEALRVLAFSNRHAVIAGRLYRTAQPSGDDIRSLVEQHQIRTIINLRGVSRNADWYLEEARTAQELNLSLEDITLSANRLPPPSELARLIEVLDHTEYPALLHCKRGADRTGLASAVALLLTPGVSYSEATRQLWPRYGHFEFGRTAAIDAFFDFYEAWMEREGVAHTPERFRHWAAKVYSPGPARSELKWLDTVPRPLYQDQPFTLRLRATNRSTEPWQLKPGNCSGIQLGYKIANQQIEVLFQGQAGLLEASVPPGESFVFTLVIPALKQPGRYALVAELHNAIGAAVPIRRNSFVQFGDEPIMAEVIVSERALP